MVAEQWWDSQTTTLAAVQASAQTHQLVLRPTNEPNSSMRGAAEMTESEFPVDLHFARNIRIDMF
jgi:hypothetical protein